MSTDFQYPDRPGNYHPFDRKEKKPGRLEKFVRVAALLALCGMVWYFSYDQGRVSNNRRLARLEMENISLREKLALAEADLEAVRESAAEAVRRARAGAGQNGPNDQNIPPSDQNGRPAGRSARGDRVGAGPADSAVDAGSAAVTSLASRPADDQGAGRLTLKLAGNKSAFGGAAVLSLVEADSLDQSVVVRIRENGTGNRTAASLDVGELFEFQLAGERHSLYLDSVRGTLAFFILDGLPGGTAVEPAP
ncbi:MAG: hypothetical protein LBO05_11005 [Deltaproteobacteria bacterium]|jgi:hypothetical protein|nr:hypothetical protein [Deltaproteobacteria bacterium]